MNNPRIRRIHRSAKFHGFLKYALTKNEKKRPTAALMLSVSWLFFLRIHLFASMLHEMRVYVMKFRFVDLVSRYVGSAPLSTWSLA